MKADKNVPYSIAGVDAQWLTGMLKKAGLLSQGEVTRLDLKLIGEEAGFLGQVAVLAPTYSEPTSAPASLILKIPIASKNRVMGQSLGVYEREIRFYTELKNELNVRSPAYYCSVLSAFDEPEVVSGRLRALARLPILVIILLALLVRFVFSLIPRRYVLLIEDVSHLQLGDQHAGCGTNELKWALTAMAKLHAPYWHSEQAERDIPWITALGYSAKLIHMMYLQSARAYEKDVFSQLSERQRRLFKWVGEYGVEITEVLGEQPRTLLHGDFRLDNVCFDLDQSEVLLLDWQTMTFGSAGLELAYFLSSALSAADDEETVTTLINHYHQTLALEGVEVSADYLRWSYELGMLATLHRIAPILHQEQLDLGDNRGPETMQRWVDCIYRRLDDVDFESILERRPEP